MMKHRLLFAGLVASAALVGCTNDEFLETAGSESASKGETSLVFDGFGGATDTRMAYDDGSFKWQKNDEIGVRRVSGDIVISNTMFKVVGTSDQNVGDPSTWNKEQGAYAYFESNDETLHEADYIVTFPYDKSSVQDGKVIGRLPVAQVANENDGTLNPNNEYAGNYGFMMSTATHMEGGQNTEHFTLYPVFSRIAFNITESTTLDEVKVQSIILESQDGSAIFPTTLEVGADVKVAADGSHLDTSYMTPGEEKVSEIVLTTVETELNAATPKTWYMTLVPGTYDKFQVRVNTNKGYFVKTYDGRTFNTGNSTTANIDITSLEPYTEYVVASEIDWKQALGNIAAYLSSSSGNPSIGNTSTIRVLGNVEIDAENFRAAALSTRHTINVVGDGSITIDGDLTQKTTSPDVTTTLGIMNFNVPVTVKGSFYEVAEGDQLTFAELNVVGGSGNIGNFNPTNGQNYTSIVVKKGVVTGTTTYHTSAANAALTMENVAFGGLVTVSAMETNGNNADTKTTKVNFKNCTFAGGLDAENKYSSSKPVYVTVDGGSVENQAGTAALSLGWTAGSETYAKSTVYVKGNVSADVVDVNGDAVETGVLDIIGNLTVNSKVDFLSGVESKIYVEKDATLTLGENATFNVVSANAALLEGTLVNNGLMTVPEKVVLTDIEHNNQHLGTINNNGVLFAPAAKWYENQYVSVNHVGDYEYVLSNVTTANLADAVKASEDADRDDITGVELTNTSGYTFTTGTNYSAYDLYVTANTTLTAPGCTFGNMTVRADVTLDNQAASTTEFDNVVIEKGKLTIDNTTGAATTLKCDDMDLFKNTTLEHANQLDCANEAWSDGYKGTVIWD